MLSAPGYIRPQTGASNARRVVRGGSYWNHARNCRSAYRNANEPGNRNRNLGFRLAAARPQRESAADQAPAAPGTGPVRTPHPRVSVAPLWRARTLPGALFRWGCPAGDGGRP